jgi:excisionase family DNA binding protein
MTDLPKLLSIREAAKTLNLGRTKIYELMKAGELPSLKCGRRRLIHLDEILALIERMRRKVGGEG